MNFNDLRNFYNENFGLGYLNPPPKGEQTTFERRLILISLICYITYKSKLKNPDTTHYQIIFKLSEKLGLPDKFIKGLAIICEDFSYQCTEFPTFGLKGNDIIKEVRSILASYIPF